MKASKYLFLLIIFSFFSCSDKEEVNPGIEETFWIYSYLIPTLSTTSLHSPGLIITFGEEFDFDRSKWEIIPLEIEGYVFKPTYFQKVLVLKTEDLSSGKIQRKLIRVLQEEKDYFDLFNGSWKVKKFMGIDLPNDDFPEGQSVGLFGLLRMAVSSDGCNQITLEIKNVGQNKILTFGSMTSTAKACVGELQILPFPGLSKNFKREENTLTFYSDTEGEIAVWEKLN